ncbi:SRPBCC domain-containing protein [Flavobacterium quisquiliarum]|uniref:SRPBCC domain-containing protein n=1 Tax=Flavobacterium quisquiliarum TaxID=1834436 RepID=A0ABV8W6J0_9FLAO|nr:SRPBCC domain-containing protein [Flavobacterium quisquiliarum]MBW1657071.1 SRPBCC domain-containing protein [Flavobacterium quisquiliarum]NWK99737.1 ATPase [Flavobacterium collinsii]
MEKLIFNIDIKASKEKIWKVLWDDETYRKWTNVFAEGSYAESNWNEGDKIYFLGPGGGGMNSIIEKKIPNEYMAFKHLGEIKDFKELPIDNKTNEWYGSMETYRLDQKGDIVDLHVEVDVIEQHIDYFKDAFPKALEIIKKLSEG